MELQKEVKNNKEKNDDYSFISEILKQNIGLIIDDFLKTNMGQQINKYNANTFALWCADGIEKSYNEIGLKVYELIKKK